MAKARAGANDLKTCLLGRRHARCASVDGKNPARELHRLRHCQRRRLTDRFTSGRPASPRAPCTSPRHHRDLDSYGRHVPACRSHRPIVGRRRSPSLRARWLGVPAAGRRRPHPARQDRTDDLLAAIANSARRSRSTATKGYLACLRRCTSMISRRCANACPRRGAAEGGVRAWQAAPGIKISTETSARPRGAHLHRIRRARDSRRRHRQAVRAKRRA